jgi:hypothetical protein
VFTGDDAASETKVTRGGTIMTAKELKLDYFQIYDVANRQATGNIFLQGQFDKQRLRMQLALLDFFANPVAKNAEPIYDKNAHLTWYRGGVQPPEPMRAVILENQFGKFEIRTGRGEGLLVPTQKKEPGSVFPTTLDHYKVYLWWTWGRYPMSPSSCGINSAPPRPDWDDHYFFQFQSENATRRRSIPSRTSAPTC